MPEPLKKVLIITYYWPPSGGAGVQRWLKFVKYLPEFNIKPYVITVDPQQASYAQVDESLLHEIPKGIEIFFTKTFEPYNLYKSVSGKKEIPYGGFVNEKKPGMLQKLSRFVRSNLFIPDPRKGWNKYAYLKAKEIIEKEKIETVITTSPPHSSQLIGLKLKKNLNIKWIADLRDPWTDIYYYKDLYHSPVSAAIDKFLERKVLKRADNVITVSPSLKSIFENKVRKQNSAKFIVIPNGFDTDDYNYTLKNSNEFFTITYTGTITSDYSISIFLMAIKTLLANGKNKLKIRFIGKQSNSLIESVKSAELENYFEFIGYVEHSRSIFELQKSDALLLIIPNVKDNEGILTGKLFEYIGSGKPVIGIGPAKGDAAKIILESKAGNMFDYDDYSNLTDFIEKLYNNWNSNNFSNDIIINDSYSRKSLTGSLNKII